MQMSRRLRKLHHEDMLENLADLPPDRRQRHEEVLQSEIGRLGARRVGGDVATPARSHETDAKNSSGTEEGQNADTKITKEIRFGVFADVAELLRERSGIRIFGDCWEVL